MPTGEDVSGIRTENKVTQLRTLNLALKFRNLGGPKFGVEG